MAFIEMWKVRREHGVGVVWVENQEFWPCKFKCINIQCRVLEETDGWGIGEKSGQLSACR